MKLLIASDLHGSAHYANNLYTLWQQEAPDVVLLLGDLLYHGPRNDLPEQYAPKEVIAILNKMKDKILAVRGNCDSEVDQMVLEFPILSDFAVLALGGTLVCATHGHNFGPQNPPPLAKGGILLCGHTHIGAEEKRDEYVYLNPGSLSIPKDGQHSYMLFENGVFTRYNLQKEVLGQWSLAE